MDPIIDTADMIARTPGGAMGIFVVAPIVFSLVIALGTKSPPAGIGAYALAMAACIVGLDLSPWLFLMVACTGLAGVGIFLQMGWRG